MYESHFGFSAAPFQLNPDPSFYFDSSGHKNALSYLKYGAHQGEGFIVVTGEIGAGKTTLVRTLLEGLDPTTVAAAQVVSTQLESGDLLRAILAAFGITSSGDSKAQLIATLEAYLTALAVGGRRALLVVDEAQNLDRTAVEELRMLSNFQLGTHGLLQSFLVGQPELRAILQSKSMEQLRQRVIASCHLGPLDEAETRSYVEHRLRKVGWSDRPRFEDDAFAQIFLWTSGIPRRVNRLCNRILLSSYLTESETVTADLVLQTAQELHSEIGDGDAILSNTATPAVTTTPTTRLLGTAESGAPTSAPIPAQLVRRKGSKLVAPLICLVDTPSEYIVSCAIAQALREQSKHQEVLTIHMGHRRALDFAEDLQRALPGAAIDVHLNAGSPNDAKEAGDLLVRFDAVMTEHAPSAVLLVGQSNAALSCGLWAHRQSIPVAQLRSGQRRAWASKSMETNLELAERFAKVLYTADLDGYYALHRAGIPAERAHCVGDVLQSALQKLRSLLPDAASVLSQINQLRVASDAYALITLQYASGKTSAVELARMVGLLIESSRHMPLVWIVTPETVLELKAAQLHDRLAEARVHLISDCGYFDAVSLLQGSRCLVTDNEGSLIDEAMAIGIVGLILTPMGLYRADPLAAKERDAAVDMRHLPDVLRIAFKEAAGPCRAPNPAVANPLAALAGHLGTWLAPARAPGQATPVPGQNVVIEGKGATPSSPELHQ